jgi:hypothetical protein
LASEGCLLVPSFSGTPVATCAWPTWVVSQRRVLVVVFDLLESPSPSRRIFIGSHSLPPSLVRRIGPSLMHGRAPRGSHFRAFGCRCFILKKGRLDKFESRSSDGIFLGYASHSRAFRVLNLDINLVMETCEGPIRRPERGGGSEWEPIKILLLRENSA